jgi:hypothetical protein
MIDIPFTCAGTLVAPLSLAVQKYVCGPPRAGAFHHDGCKSQETHIFDVVFGLLYEAVLERCIEETE